MGELSRFEQDDDGGRQFVELISRERLIFDGETSPYRKLFPDFNAVITAVDGLQDEIFFVFEIGAVFDNKCSLYG